MTKEEVTHLLYSEQARAVLAVQVRRTSLTRTPTG